MFFGKLIIFLPLVITIALTFSALLAPQGSIEVSENPDGTGITMDFKEWSSKKRCELSLNKGDVIKVDVFREKGEIALTISGKNGSEPYTGNNLKSGLFTVTVSEKDEYEIQITGKKAAGKVSVSQL